MLVAPSDADRDCWYRFDMIIVIEAGIRANQFEKGIRIGASSDKSSGNQEL